VVVKRVHAVVVLERGRPHGGARLLDEADNDRVVVAGRAADETLQVLNVLHCERNNVGAGNA